MQTYEARLFTRGDLIFMPLQIGFLGLAAYRVLTAGFPAVGLLIALAVLVAVTAAVVLALAPPASHRRRRRRPGCVGPALVI